MLLLRIEGRLRLVVSSRGPELGRKEAFGTVLGCIAPSMDASGGMNRFGPFCAVWDRFAAQGRTPFLCRPNFEVTQAHGTEGTSLSTEPEPHRRPLTQSFGSTNPGLRRDRAIRKQRP